MNSLKKILIIDDEEITTHIISQKIQKKGYNVTVLNQAHKVIKDLSLLKDFDLILLDIVMPETSGIEILKLIRNSQEYQHVPIIMMTAQSSVEDVVNALELGANDYISKPVNFDILISRINTQYRLLELRQEQEQRKQVEAINAMVATYHHELNTPLSIAFTSLEKIKKENQENINIERLEFSLYRISNIIEKIQRVKESSEISFKQYMSDSQMVDLEDKEDKED